ncbi:MAG: glycosyltransferase [Desulfitobacterium hafniense]|nr:glycosyltransferase [Desulfitobacterium hafniense]
MGNDEIKVSVIVPIYNVERYLSKCIETIIKQSHKNLEIILVDDGSKDSSGEISDRYAVKDKRIKVIHQMNSGVSAARNAGIDESTGDYICFSDGDDYLMPDYVDYLLKIAIQNNADISLTTEMFSNYNLNQIKKDKIEVYSAEKATAEILCYNIPIGVYCKMFKRSFIGDKIRFLPNLYIGEGFNFNTAAFQRANIVGVGHRRIYYYRRDNPTSATTKFSIDKWINGLMAIEVIQNDFIIKTQKLDNAWKFANWRTHSDVYDIMILSSAENKYPEMYRKCLYVTRTKALYSMIVPTSFREKIRAIIMMICPRLIPQLMIWRRIKYHIDVEN